MKRGVRIVALWSALALPACAQSPDPLPSWNPGQTKQTIVEFVTRVTRAGGPEFVPVAERIATFDNDGTLWAEQPMYFQLAFALDRAKVADPRTVLAQGERGIIELVTATHSNLTVEEFDQAVRDWLATARHPTTGRPYTEMVYQPMLELLAYLRANGFKTYIVSAGGVDFMRAFAEAVYGIPPEQVIGSMGKVQYEVRDGAPVLVKIPGVHFVDEKEGKPVGIQRAIGRRPIAAFGNSDGDLQMLQWTAAGPGARLAVYIHHTDAAREWAYDRASSIGRLDKGLDEANAQGWTVVDMQRDWKAIFP